jgi:hypothetical protein
LSFQTCFRKLVFRSTGLLAAEVFVLAFWSEQLPSVAAVAIRDPDETTDEELRSPDERTGASPYAAGKHPGGFFKREARQRDEEILTCRIMDRPLPPALPRGLQEGHADHRDGALGDKQNKADVLALTGASARSHLRHPVGRPDRGRPRRPQDGELVVYPTFERARRATSTSSSPARRTPS